MKPGEEERERKRGEVSPFNEGEAESVEDLHAFQQIGVHYAQHEVLGQYLHEEVHEHEVQVLIVEGADGGEGQVRLRKIALQRLFKGEVVEGVPVVCHWTISWRGERGDVRYIWAGRAERDYFS